METPKTYEEKTKIKHDALKKLDEFVSGVITYCKDSNIQDVLGELSSRSIIGLTEEEYKEIRTNIESIRVSIQRLYSYCRNRGIKVEESPENLQCLTDKENI